MWAAEQILRLKEQPGYEDIELVVALPFVGHDAKWDQRSKRRMEFILQHCSKKEVIGNLIDRVLNGEVVDYINVLFMRFAVFNFADICVCVGVALWVLVIFLEEVQEQKES